MGILTKVGTALQRLFGDIAQKAADDSGVIQRTRKFTGLSLARTFVLGFLNHPRASDEKLAQMAVECGADVTPQAIDQRHTPRLVDFLKRLFRGATQMIVGSDRSLAPILERFTGVWVLDSSTITLPDEMAAEYRGCGGSHGGGAAALKLQTESDLRSGAVTHVEIEPGRRPDAATARQEARHGPGSLRITDLGYFNLLVFAAIAAAKEYFLSRLQYHTTVWLTANDASIDLMRWLSNQAARFIDREVVLGQDHRLACRLIAWRVPPEQANRRRAKLHREMRRQKGREPSAERLAWCDWTILITNVPVTLLSPDEATVMYRARWQVELLFKRWKSQGLIAELSGSTVVRQMVRVWSRLLAALVQHWLVISSIGGDPTRSLVKACEAIRVMVGRLAAALTEGVDLERALEQIRRIIAKTCRRDKRSKPGTFELLNNTKLSDFR